MASCTNTTVRFQLRRATESEWISANPVLLLGEPAYSTDKIQLKIGDGFTNWSALPYINVAGLSGGAGQVGVPTNMATTAYLTPQQKDGTIIKIIATPITLTAGKQVMFTIPMPDSSAANKGLFANSPYYVVSYDGNTSLVVSLTQTPLVRY